MKKVKTVLLYAAVVPLVIIGVATGISSKAAGSLFVFDADSAEEGIRSIGV